jgi:hypothetical protein
MSQDQRGTQEGLPTQYGRTRRFVAQLRPTWLACPNSLVGMKRNTWSNCPNYTDALLDRIVHTSHKIALRGESMRKLRAKKVS